MKKYLVLSIAALLALASCHKSSQENVPATPVDDNSPVPVQFSAKLPTQAKGATKSAIGALDQWHENQKLYVYAIAREGSNSAATQNVPLDLRAGNNNDYPGILINNVQATFPAAFVVEDPQTPQLVSVIRDRDEPYYYDEDRRYEFFGYYVDDAFVTEGATPEPTIGETNISLGVKIDGSQDLMVAKTDKELDNEADMNPNRLYSAYSARHGVTPNLIFEHLLSRFNVYVKSGDQNVTEKITITSFAIASKRDGTVFVAYKDHANAPSANQPNLTVTGETYTFLPLWNGSNGSATKQLLLADLELDNYDGTLALDNEHITVAADKKYTGRLADQWPLRSNPLGTVMVMPFETEYEIKVGLTQEGYYGGDKEVISTYTVSFVDLLSPDEDPKLENEENIYERETITNLDAQSEPGHQYDLNVVIYGLEEVQITVTMQPWQDSGNFVLDQDEDEAIAINIDDLDSAQSANYGKGKALNPLVLSADTEAANHTYTIAATTKPEVDGEGNPIVLNYSSSDESVVTVSEQGVITAVGAGDAKIFIKADPFTTGSHPRPEGGYRAIRVRVSDGDPAPTPEQVVFTAADNVNFANVVLASEEVKNIASLFTLSDGYEGTPTYAITAGNEGDFFTLNGSTLTAGTADEDAHTITVTVTAPANGNFTEATQDIVFNVAAVEPEPDPTPVAVPITAKDNVTFGSVEMAGSAALDLTTLFALPEDYAGEVTYAITDGDSSFFSLAGSTLTSSAADEDAHTVTVTVSAAADAEHNYAANTQAIVVKVLANN